MELSRNVKKMLNWLNDWAFVGYTLTTHPELDLVGFNEILEEHGTEWDKLIEEYKEARAKKIEELEEAENGG